MEFTSTILQERLEIKDEFFIQFEDPEFGNELCNLTNIAELPPDRAVLKILWKVPEESESDISISSLDTASMSSPSSSSNQSSSSLTIRQRENSQWPSTFPIPKFSYDVELRLAKGNEKFKEDGTLLAMPREMKMDILDNIAEAIFAFKAYPNCQELESVSAALIEMHPCLKDPGSGTGYHSWTMSIKYKVGNYCQKLRSVGCSEVARCEVNFLPDNPLGQTDSSLQKEKEALQEELKKKRLNMAFVDSKMELTLSLRRKEIVEEEHLVTDILKQWPALFLEDQICAEFYRITQTNLKSTFFSYLDEYAPRMIKLYRVRGGAHEDDMKTLLDQLDNQTSDVLAYRKATALKGLPLFLREKSEYFLKTCLIGILTIVEDDVATIHSNTNVRCLSLVLEEHIVLDNVRDLPTAMALLFGLIYALNMNYPKELKYTFEMIQRVFIGLDPQCSARVQSFKNKLLMTK
ncbi:hypothetical protein IRJ41_005945 [Triplophysa rosa]|uniref:Sterile alpha motif domain-containing protein 3 n=1 Tax=Triplophysa rosa TaxID=992332 RepID=A0A9W7TD30_TRIRA|nr:hypothetical protein IRJ41_005945 [Triplophysa rosa]